MSEYECIRCRKKLTLNTTSRTTDLKDLCHECYSLTSSELCKGLFSSEEVFTVFQQQKSDLSLRVDMIRTMLQATLLNGDNSTKMIHLFEAKAKQLAEQHYNSKVKELSTKAKNNIVNLIYLDYKNIFGDFGAVECRDTSIRDEKGMYYEWLDNFNSDVKVKIVEDNGSIGTSSTSSTNNTSYFFK